MQSLWPSLSFCDFHLQHQMGRAEEVADALRFEPGQQPCNCADLIGQVFSVKVDESISGYCGGQNICPVILCLRVRCSIVFQCILPLLFTIICCYI